MAHLELKGYTEEERDKVGEFITIFEAISSKAYTDLLEYEKTIDVPLNRAHIASILRLNIQHIVNIINDPRMVDAMRKGLFEFYFREKKDPFSV